MAISSIKAIFHNDIKDVWNVVTSLENFQWRSDLNKIEIISDTQFIEYTKDGFATTFTITTAKPFERWEFDMENDHMKGHWTGVFCVHNGDTEIEFTEDVAPKKWIMKPFIRSFLKKQQTLYLSDLRKALQL